MASNEERLVGVPRRALLAGCAAGLALPVSQRAMARERPASGGPASTVVPDVIDAEAESLVEVRYIPNDSRSAQIVVKNVSERPLTLRLPAAFVGVPVLAQMGGMGGMGGGMNRGGGGMGAGGFGGGQVTGGGGMGMGGMGMGGMGGGMGGMPGMGGGQFSIPPERTRVAKVQTVCLEYGKDEPSPRMAYRLQRPDSFTSDPRVVLILESLGRGELPQKVAQAATWHVANGLSWQQLAAETIDHLVGPDEPFFTQFELGAAARVVARVEQLVGANSPTYASPGERSAVD